MLFTDQYITALEVSERSSEIGCRLNNPSFLTYMHCYYADQTQLSGWAMLSVPSTHNNRRQDLLGNQLHWRWQANSQYQQAKIQIIPTYKKLTITQANWLQLRKIHKNSQILKHKQDAVERPVGWEINVRFQHKNGLYWGQGLGWIFSSTRL